MTAQELGAATKRFDQPLVVDQSRPLTAAEREDWKRVKRRGRPKVGQGHKRISVTIEKGLVKRATALAKKRRVSRSKLWRSHWNKLSHAEHEHLLDAVCGRAARHALTQSRSRRWRSWQA